LFRSLPMKEFWHVIIKLQICIYMQQKRKAWGLTITEALACATPVIATAVGGIPEQVQDGHTGILVEINNEEEFANNIEYLLEDDQLRERWGKMRQIMPSSISIFQCKCGII